MPRSSRPKTAGAKQDAADAAVPAQVYYSMFQGHPDGQRILDELSQLFYDRLAPAEPNTALYMEGQRSVVHFLLAKCSEGQK